MKWWLLVAYQIYSGIANGRLLNEVYTKHSKVNFLHLITGLLQKQFFLLIIIHCLKSNIQEAQWTIKNKVTLMLLIYTKMYPGDAIVNYLCTDPIWGLWYVLYPLKSVLFLELLLQPQAQLSNFVYPLCLYTM